jgi:ribulose-5-phosphate 4-epimerase/fuculose-1-phosphate aldolase
MTPVGEVAAAARVVAAHGLVDAFGHVSARLDVGGLAITPPVPLGGAGEGDAIVTVDAGEAGDLPAGAPKEAWIHLAIYARRPDVRGICRAQPPAVAATAAAGLEILALHGQGAFLGSPVAVHDHAALIRDRASGVAVAEALGDGDAVVLRGNGAVTVGRSPGEAAARMVVLEASARLNLAAAAAGGRVALRPDELAAWRAVAPEILGRLWAHLRDGAAA